MRLFARLFTWNGTRVLIALLCHIITKRKLSFILLISFAKVFKNDHLIAKDCWFRDFFDVGKLVLSVCQNIHIFHLLVEIETSVLFIFLEPKGRESMPELQALQDSNLQSGVCSVCILCLCENKNLFWTKANNWILAKVFVCAHNSMFVCAANSCFCFAGGCWPSLHVYANTQCTQIFVGQFCTCRFVTRIQKTRKPCMLWSRNWGTTTIKAERLTLGVRTLRVQPQQPCNKRTCMHAADTAETACMCLIVTLDICFALRTCERWPVHACPHQCMCFKNRSNCARTRTLHTILTCTWILCPTPP